MTTHEKLSLALAACEYLAGTGAPGAERFEETAEYLMTLIQTQKRKDAREAKTAR